MMRDDSCQNCPIIELITCQSLWLHVDEPVRIQTGQELKGKSVVFVHSLDRMNRSAGVKVALNSGHVVVFEENVITGGANGKFMYPVN